MNNKLIPIVITLVVGIILAGSVLMPVLNDAQKDLGNPTIANNTMKSDDFNYTIWKGEDFSLVYESGTVTINGEDATAYYLAGGNQRIVIASNDFATRTGGTADNPTLNSEYIGDTSGWGSGFSFTVTDGQYSLVKGTAAAVTGTLKWMVYADENGTANLGMVSDSSNAFYTSNVENLIVLGNIYTTGENDTFYSYYNGELTVNEAYADSSNVTITKTIANGYTDIYATTITVNVDGESFTPYFVLTPKAIAGHEAAGASYSLLGAIPVMVIVALIMGAVGMIVVKRND